MALTSYLHLPREQRIKTHSRRMSGFMALMCLALLAGLLDRSTATQVMVVVALLICGAGVGVTGFQLLFENNRNVFLAELKKASARHPDNPWALVGDVDKAGADIVKHLEGPIRGTGADSVAVVLVNGQGTTTPSAVQLSVRSADGTMELRAVPDPMAVYAMGTFPSPMGLGRDWRLTVITSGDMPAVTMLNDDQYASLAAGNSLDAEALRRFHPAS